MQCLMIIFRCQSDCFLTQQHPCCCCSAYCHLMSASLLMNPLKVYDKNVEGRVQKVPEGAIEIQHQASQATTNYVSK